MAFAKKEFSGIKFGTIEGTKRHPGDFH